MELSPHPPRVTPRTLSDVMSVEIQEKTNPSSYPVIDNHWIVHSQLPGTGLLIHPFQHLVKNSKFPVDFTQVFPIPGGPICLNLKQNNTTTHWTWCQDLNLVVSRKHIVDLLFTFELSDVLSLTLTFPLHLAVMSVLCFLVHPYNSRTLLVNFTVCVMSSSL